MENQITRKELCDKFGYSLTTISRDLRAMRANSEFKKYIQKTGHRTVRIDLEGYRKFLDFKEQQYKKVLWNAIIISAHTFFVNKKEVLNVL